MALDPRIALAGRTIDIGGVFDRNLARQENIKNAPLRNQLLEAQVGQAEAGTAATQAGTEQTTQLNRIRSLAVFGSDIAGDIQSGNLESIKRKANQRVVDLTAKGIQSDDSAEFIQFLNDPNIPDEEKIAEAGRLSQQANQLAVQTGALKAPSGASKSKFIGTPSRIVKDGQNFLSGIVQQVDGSFKLEEVPVGGDFVSILGETGAEETERAIVEAGGKTTAVGEAEALTPIGKQELRANIAQEAVAKERAQVEKRERKVKRLEAVSQADSTIGLIDDLIVHKGRKAATGGSAKLPTRPGSKAADFEASFNRLKGSAFLEAVQKLKGSGQISNAEGEAATASILGVELTQSEDGFVESLKSLRARIVEAKKRRGGTFEDAPASVGRFQIEEVQ